MKRKNQKSPALKIAEHILSLLLVALLLLTVAIRRDGTIVGEKIEDLFSSDDTTQTILNPTELELKQLQLQESDLTALGNGRWKINDTLYLLSSEPYNEGITGFNGNTPLLIKIVRKDLKTRRIQQVIGRANNETPGFWRRVVRQGLLDQWNNLSLNEALAKEVDVVSGATYSSKAIIENLHATLQYATQYCTPTSENFTFSWDSKNIAVALVLLFGLLCAYRLKSKNWRWIQLLLNIVVLGYWAGTFISLQMLVGWLSQGINLASVFTLFLLVALAIFLPFFGKKNYYCNHVCPFGAAQEAVGRLTKKKWHLPKSVNKVLKQTRRLITALLFITLWLGVGFDLINYEPFSAFLFEQADVVVLILAGTFLLLSLFIPRPYCRFVCPTGQLLSWSQQIRKK